MTSAPIAKAFAPQRAATSASASGRRATADHLAPDGQRFLMITDTDPSEATTTASLVVVLNWQEELQRRVGAR